MSLWNLFTPGVQAVTGLTKTIFGDKAQREIAIANESMAAHQEHAQEFRVANRTWLDSVMDALNRLPRPMIVGSSFYMFWLAYDDPAKFSVIMAAIALIPDQLWTLLGIIAAFYLPSSAVGTAIEKIGTKKLDEKAVKIINAQAKEVIRMKKELGHEEIDGLPWLENPAIAAWKAKKDNSNSGPGLQG